VLGAGE